MKKKIFALLLVLMLPLKAFASNWTYVYTLFGQYWYIDKSSVVFRYNRLTSDVYAIYWIKGLNKKNNSLKTKEKHAINCSKRVLALVEGDFDMSATLNILFWNDIEPDTYQEKEYNTVCYK